MVKLEFKMHLDGDDVTGLADALERQIEAQGEAAKRAIREYKKAILHATGSGGVRQINRRRDVEHAVSQYMQDLGGCYGCNPCRRPGG